MSDILSSALDAERRASAAADAAAKTRAATHYGAMAAALHKPRQPARVAAWLAQIPADILLAEAQTLAREVALLKGVGHTPQRGCSFITKPLGESEALVEFEYTPGRPGRYFGPPEDCYPDEPAEVTILQVLINGQWCDPADFIADAILDRWQEEIEQEAGDNAADEREAA
jgi:hypothetical protein